MGVWGGLLAIHSLAQRRGFFPRRWIGSRGLLARIRLRGRTNGYIRGRADRPRSKHETSPRRLSPGRRDVILRLRLWRLVLRTNHRLRNRLTFATGLPVTCFISGMSLRLHLGVEELWPASLSFSCAHFGYLLCMIIIVAEVTASRTTWSLCSIVNCCSRATQP